MTELKYRGRMITSEDILFIEQLIAAHPRASRRRLSQKLCEAWQSETMAFASTNVVRSVFFRLNRPFNVPDA